MGGIGSGRSGGMSTTVEDCNYVDIRWLHKNKLLAPHPYGELSWNRGGRNSGKINYVMHEDKMVLKFRVRPNSSAEWQDVNQIVYFETTDCNYGGSRKWFSCPSCGKRVAVLYAPGTYFYCRQCYKLPYRSTQESKASRIYSRKHKLGKEIFQIYEGGTGYFKKKGMHQKTFDRKLARYRQLEAQANAHCEKLINMLNGKP